MRHFYLIFLLLTSALTAQVVPVDNGVLYTATEIPKIYISIDPDSLDDLYLEENWYENYHYQAVFVFETQAGFDTLENIGLRFRGNTARDKMKKSFKISFNTYAPGRKFHGVEKLNINAETNDPSMLRSRICWDMFHEYDVAAPRSNHVELYVNGDYYGLYQNTEHIDEEFVDTWFGNKKGNLYKCSYPANLDYVSDNPDDYKMAPFGDRTYELKTNTELDDYSKLADFIAFLNQSSDGDFRCNYAEYFNVIQYLKIAAIDVLTGNWDGYIYNNNNFYLYENPLTGQIEYIPYDLDNTWGIDWVDRDWPTRNIYEFDRHSQPRKLYTRLMDEAEYRAIFTWYLGNMLETYFNTSQHRQAVESLRDFITAAALADPYRPLDYGYNNADFLTALYDPTGGHVDYSVFEYADIREETAGQQLESTPIAPIISQVKPDFSDLPDFWKVTAYTDGPASASANISYSINGVQQPGISGVQNGNTFSFTIPLSENPISLAYNISVIGENGLSRSAFCESKTIHFNTANNTIVINELMPSNQTTIADEAGGYADWIELYNAAPNAINLSRYYLSDNKSAPLKWNIPDVTMNPGSFLLLWADGNTEEGALHTNFNLSAAGEKVYLFKKQNDELTVLDKIDMPATPTDYSFGRESDAGLPWVQFSATTPNASNNGGITGLENITAEKISVYPNPTQGMVYFSEKADFRLSDLSGRILIEGQGDFVDLSSYAPGFYLVEVGATTFRIFRI
ncbi:hypothetical protein G3O08_10565 [Cryomorpha ignava]|uniref:LTD domain-containing protein n=1 Tax=Cryomorpha ignava TaxID=101383 RepID=A0A7K3WSA1_9FLAO|nr:CotH kinase family protein [Cryomorpha ignava]NEN23941.1 hypothetical protein [Cryomorpha ignava]